MSPMPIVLASTSPYRRALLDQLGLVYEISSPRYEEDHSLDLTPEEMVRTFARGKAQSLASRHPEAAIIGCDQLAVLDDRILTKPGTAERAVEQLMALSGRTHQLITAVAVHVPATGVTLDEMTVHSMRMRPLNQALAAAYVRAEAPLNCAGAYKVETAGALLFEEMAGPDHTGIIGLPVTVVARLLGELGMDLLERAVARPR